jgi:hypothetical protein
MSVAKVDRQTGHADEGPTSAGLRLGHAQKGDPDVALHSQTPYTMSCSKSVT